MMFGLIDWLLDRVAPMGLSPKEGRQDADTDEKTLKWLHKQIAEEARRVQARGCYRE